MRRVLVADDDPSIRKVILRGLSPHGYDVTAVENGLQAFAALGAGAFDLVVTDINMPDMDGIELLTRLIEQGLETKVIAISGGGLFPKGELLADARLLGAVDIVEKPFDIATLLAHIESALDRP